MYKFFSNKTKSKFKSTPLIVLMLNLLLFIMICCPEKLNAEKIVLKKQIINLIKTGDALLVTDINDKIILSKNADQKMVPASILKIFTSCVALYYLGPDYKFITEFYYDDECNLKVKGYGDPLILTEILIKISQILSDKISKVNNIILDNSFFQQPIIIPGKTLTDNPYDAPNGALCANFNTISFYNYKGVAFSAETYTPLLPFILNKLKNTKSDKRRVVVSFDDQKNTLYAGYLLSYFLQQNKITLSGEIRTGKVQKNKDKLILKYYSEFTLKEVVSKLLKYSNNFMANQLLVHAGAVVYSPPGTLAKGVMAANFFAQKILKIKNLKFIEGSGISRDNKICANTMDHVLKQFEPYYLLLQKNNKLYFKTGTLKGINTRAGYIKTNKKQLYRFSLFLNSSNSQSAENIIKKIITYLK